MSERWQADWFPVVGMFLQVILWGQIVPRIVSPQTVALLTFERLPEDPTW